MGIDVSKGDLQANMFARALLMPKEQFLKKAWQCYDNDTETFNTEEIAKYFNVPAVQVHFRGVEIGLFRNFLIE